MLVGNNVLVAVGVGVKVAVADAAGLTMTAFGMMCASVKPKVSVIVSVTV